MQLDSGIAIVWRGRNTAPAGSKPEILYDKEFFSSYYANKTVGINRYWTALSHNDKADLLIEIQRNAGISTADRCQLNPAFDEAEAGIYKILQVQHSLDDDGQPVTDLTLERIGDLDAP